MLQQTEERNRPDKSKHRKQRKKQRKQRGKVMVFNCCQAYMRKESG